jgi:glycine/D-amino acid oxidase-like deaminating enzyme
LTSDEAGEGDNLWRATSREHAEAAPLAGDAEADLAIVGGGFTGCAAALHAAKAGASVRLVEARDVGFGGSGRNVGLVNAGLWLPPDAVVAAMGEAAGRKLNRLLGDAPALVFSLIEEHAIDCEPVRNGTLHCAHSPAGFEDLRERYRQLSRDGAPVALLSRDETAERVGSRSLHGALHDARAGTIQPLAYCQGLARAAIAAGATLHSRSPAIAIRRDGGRWRVEMPGGFLRARALLLATNAYHLPVAGLSAPQSIGVGYFQMATEPLTGDAADIVLPGGEGCWDSALVMSSFRKDKAGRLIIGGIGSLAHAAGGVHRRWAMRKLVRMFPQLGKPHFEEAWFGRIAMTSDHVPKILDIGPDALAIFGYSGRGIGPGTLFGSRAAQALLAGDREHLPMAPIDAHHEAMSTMRALYYETGAVLNHAVSCRR